MPYPRSEDKAKQTIKDIYELEQQAGQLLLQIDEKKKTLEEYFNETNTKALNVTIGSLANTLELRAIKVERAAVTYDPTKLKANLDDETFAEVTIRTYTIKDIEKMIELMKAAGIKASMFKELIDVNVKVNNEKIKFLYDSGLLSMKRLRGCYTAKISKSIRVSEVKEKKGDGH